MSAYSDKVLADGATLYMRLDEPSGNVVSEVGGYTGTVTGGVTRNQAGALNDGNSAILSDNTGTITIAGVSLPLTCTIEGWINYSSITTHNAMFSTRGVTNGFLFGVVGFGGNQVVCYSDNSTPVQVTHPTVLISGTWYHIVFVRDGINVTIYVNGMSFTAPQTHVALTSVSARICDSGGGNPWIGKVDEVAIYPTALTPAQVATHYALRNSYDPYTQRVITDGASAYWKLDETSGTIARSVVGSFDGTIAGGVTLNQPGAISTGKAMQFDGIDDRIGIITALTLPITVTIEAWMKSTTRPSSYGTVWSDRNPPTTNTVLVGTKSSGVAVIAVDGINEIVGVKDLHDNIWHHVIWISNGTTVSIYVDGQLDRSAALARSGTITLPGFVGNDWGGGAGAFTGLIDEVAIYPYALTPTQVREHFLLKATYDPYTTRVLADGAVAYWKLDEQTGTIARSQIGAYDGTISGGVTLGQPGAVQGNSAMAFDGVNDLVAIPNGAFLSIGTGPATLEAWFKTTTPQTFKSIVDFRGQGTVDPGVSFILGGGGNTIYIEIGDGTTPRTAGGTYSYFDGKWHHLVGIITRNPDKCALYIDSVLLQQTDLLAGSALTTLKSFVGIGGNAIDGSTGSLFSQGQIDEVAIYHTALTPAQIAQHYALSSYNPAAALGLLPVGSAIPVKRYVAYALPAKLVAVTADASLEYSQDVDGPWVSVQSGKFVSGGFIRSESADTVIVCKSRR